MSSNALPPARRAAIVAPRGVVARPPRDRSEDTDEIAADSPPEFGESSQAIVIVNVCGGAQDFLALISYPHKIEDREFLARGLDQQIDVAVFARLIASDRAIEEQLSNAERAELLVVFTEET